MKAIWSFWTKPFKFRHSTAWVSERHHLFSWVLSVETAKKLYCRTALFTDEEGAELLIEGAGLKFDYVSTELNILRNHDPEWWMLGKLYTYRAQTTPFVHLDADVFLWKGLPESFNTAPVFAQNPEKFSFQCQRWYRPAFYDSAIRAVSGWLPEEWSWYISRKGNIAVCCGFLGANHIDFINYYADQAIRIIEHPANQAAWARLNKIKDNILFEQYYLAACIEYYRHNPDAAFKDVKIEYLFDSTESAFQQTNAAKYGYTHLIASAKSNQRIADRLEERVRRDYPSHYQRILTLTRYKAAC